MPAFPRAGLFVLLSTAAFGQVSSNPPVPNFSALPAFEVASVRPAVRSPGGAVERTGGGGIGGGCPTSLKVDRGRVDVRCATITMLIGYAFRISPDRVTGPDWMMGAGSPRFDIVAKIPQGGSERQVPEMLQALLADRFKLAFHRGNKNGALYALVVEKGGLKLKEAVPEVGTQVPAVAAEPVAPPSVDGFFGAVQTHTIANADGRTSTTMISNPRMGTVRQTGEPFQIQRWEAANISLEGLADLLDKVAPLSSPIVDMTGVKGRFQMVLEVSLRDAQPGRVSVSANPTAGEGPGSEMEAVVLRAFNEGLRKLGLRLERRKGAVEAVVVDHVEKTPTEN